MANITLSLPIEIKEEIKEEFSWVNWSEIARLEANKKRIFEEFIKTGELSKQDQEFCESIDWHPVDELPLKESFIKELKGAEKGSHHKMTFKELDKILDLE